MASRIDRVELTLYVYDEFEGHRLIRVPVPLPDPDFEAQVWRVWREHSERLLAAAQGTGPQFFG